MLALLRLFARAKGTALLGSFVSLAAGVSSVLLIAVINRTMRMQSASEAVIAGFVVAAVFTVTAPRRMLDALQVRLQAAAWDWWE